MNDKLEQINQIGISLNNVIGKQIFNKNSPKTEGWIKPVLIGVIAAVIGGLILLFIKFYFGW